MHQHGLPSYVPRLQSLHFVLELSHFRLQLVSEKESKHKTLKGFINFKLSLLLVTPAELMRPSIG